MNSISKALITLLAVLCTTFLIYGCSDDSSTDVDLSDAPEVPEALPVEMNNSVFTNNSVNGESYTTFNEAGAITVTAEAQVTGFSALGQSMFMFTDSQEPTFDDGVWEWTFTFSEGGGEEFRVVTTAEELSGGTEWNVSLSGNFEGESVDNFTFISGFYSNDNQTGNWQYFSPENPDIPVLEYAWNNVDQANSSFDAIIRDLDTGSESTIDYIRDGDDNTLVYDGFDSSVDVIIYWDLATGSGYIERDGNRRCWNDSFEETDCG